MKAVPVEGGSDRRQGGLCYGRGLLFVSLLGQTADVLIRRVEQTDSR